ncbi:type VII toxin-antitoxin system MntA family adenylyltransferase antitoxin [Heyndrickxia acidicola]|uniref:Nucleotidyltransferase domain-containing protein n=1 Tax=Heyndrickxia acidicola TaxID=209389 RepID=A0ABU6MFY4_9BACI|nr:nucleotidyltransferase domain-containing protein [Heyndrickxia acidicola]MED1203591.1 nucleotidyltransferase domain-containing protein [Heyndrickxia acidicola]
MKTEVAQKIKAFLIDKLNPAFLIVFGSQAKETAHKNSDMDVAFYLENRSVSSYDVFLLAQELADIIKMDVDLIDLKKASTVFKAQIYSYGKVLYARDLHLLRLKQMIALSMYAKLNEERQPILKNIDESGSIYEK